MFETAVRQRARPKREGTGNVVKEKTLYYAQLVLIAVSGAALGYAIGAGGDAGVAPMVAVFAGALAAIGGLR